MQRRTAFPFVWAAPIAVIALFSRLAAAEAGARQLDYDAPPSCPDEQAFASEVHTRAPNQAAFDNRKIDVRIRKNATTATFDGRIVMTDEDDGARERAVSGPTCDDVVRALALSVVMALADEEQTAPPSPPVANRPPREVETEPPARPKSVRWSIGAEGGVASGVGPLVAPSASAFGNLAIGRSAVRLSASYAWSPLVERSFGSARFSRAIVGVEACPYRLGGQDIAFVPCATFETGGLFAEGRSTVSPESSSRFWMAAGLGMHLSFERLSPVFIEIDARGNAPFIRDRFFFRPDEEVYKAPILTFFTGVGAGVRFL